MVRVILGALDGVEVHRPELLRQHRIGLGVVTVALAEARLVRVRRVARDRRGWDGAVVRWVLRIGEAVIAPDAAALAPPQARLADTARLTRRAKGAALAVGAGARDPAGRVRAALECGQGSVDCVAWRRDDERTVRVGIRHCEREHDQSAG